MHLTVPAASRTLKKLRTTFDDTLFIRSNPLFLPSAKANELYPQVKDILQKLGQLIDPEEFSPQRLKRTFRLGVVDNAIHTAAGFQLRRECARMMALQPGEEPPGRAKITNAYNLPCRYVLHTVGPIVRGAVTAEDRALLASCYRSCLELAAAHGCRSVAFCCVSTGEFRFPNEEAARIAVETVEAYQTQHPHTIEVIFNVFKDMDREIYQRLLG